MSVFKITAEELKCIKGDDLEIKTQIKIAGLLPEKHGQVMKSISEESSFRTQKKDFGAASQTLLTGSWITFATQATQAY